MAVTEPGELALRARRLRGSGLWLVLCAAGLLGSPAWSQTIGASPVTELHQNLHLTPQQEPAWKAYRDEASVPEKAQGRRRAAARMFPTLTSPQRMDLVEAEMRQELTDLQRQSQALKTFYAALSPEQKRVFDQQTLPPHDDADAQAPAQ